MPEPSLPTGAVFISYASQDIEAAVRICEALRAAGVEVWFDQNELRGGDSWDAQIKKHIHDCALFIPVISAHTNARAEGYFRREWKLATRRLLDIADDVAFLVPVVVDDTREAVARVPEEFLHTQWTWLRDGDTPPAFAKRVHQLLGRESTPVRHAQAGITGVIDPSARSRTSAQPWSWLTGGRGRHRARNVGVAVAALLLVVGGGAFWYYQGKSGTPVTPTHATDGVSSIVAAVPEDASIAVLPFVNMSSDPEQEYFSDGISEQVLNLLSKIPSLRVIARTSSFAFKGKADVDVATIAQRLNVAHVLEGSVRKSGNRVRITARLVKSANSSRQWSETYDRELTDIFAVQDEIALSVVNQLKIALLGDDLPARSTKTNLEAYTLYLRGQNLVDQGSEESQTKAVEYFKKALGYDPRYGEAWAALANAQANLAFQGFTDVSAGFAEARTSVKKALELNPKLARAHFALGVIQKEHDWDWLAADASFKKAIALDPSDPWALGYAGAVAQMLGNSDAGIKLNKQAVALDPISLLPRLFLAVSYFQAGQLDEAESETRKILEVSPEFSGGWNMLGTILLLKGQPKQALETIQKESVEFWRLAGLSLALHSAGQKEASDAALKEFIEKYAGTSAYQIAEAYAFRGEKEKAFAWLDRAYRQRDAGLTTFNVDPLLENLKNDPRYAAMLRKLKLPELSRDE